MNKLLSFLKKMFLTLANCVVPVLPIMIGAGMIRVLLILLGPAVLGVLSESMGTFKVLTFVADAGYYFMPIYIAVASAEVFKTNKYLAAMVGAILISPIFVGYVDSGLTLDFLKLPIAMTSYGNQILPSVLAIFVLSFVYRFFDGHLPSQIKAIFAPLLSVLIMVPVTLSLIGPLGVLMGDGLVALFLFLKTFGPLGNGIVCAILPFTVIGGLGGANLSALILLSGLGPDPILYIANIIYNSALGFVALAVYLRSRKADTLAAALTATIAGTSEPAIFGVVLGDLKALASLMIGCFFGGLYVGLMGVKTFALASFGVFGVITTIGPESSIVHGVIGIVIACAISFTISYLLHKKVEE